MFYSSPVSSIVAIRSDPKITLDGRSELKGIQNWLRMLKYSGQYLAMYGECGQDKPSALIREKCACHDKVSTYKASTNAHSLHNTSKDSFYRETSFHDQKQSGYFTAPEKLRLRCSAQDEREVTAFFSDRIAKPPFLPKAQEVNSRFFDSSSFPSSLPKTCGTLHTQIAGKGGHKHLRAEPAVATLRNNDAQDSILGDRNVDKSAFVSNITPIGAQSNKVSAEVVSLPGVDKANDMGLLASRLSCVGASEGQVDGKHNYSRKAMFAGSTESRPPRISKCPRIGILRSTSVAWSPTGDCSEGSKCGPSQSFQGPKEYAQPFRASHAASVGLEMRPADSSVLRELLQVGRVRAYYAAPHCVYNACRQTAVSSSPGTALLELMA
ncbi:unnamed protein product [Protopolystoma xenopodis]|uniref:Uncharacterized protein n=1 Tax=Protopolystoma xenopodis TaxID=117903 RepID=A0A448XMZ3_9PLAT|nr:unnamed protein product [Protopolystoma xenopodis]